MKTICDNIIGQIDSADPALLLLHYGYTPNRAQTDDRWTEYHKPDNNQPGSIRVSNGHRVGGLYVARAWETTDWKHKGYGCLSLASFLSGVPVHGVDLRRQLSHLSPILSVASPVLSAAFVNGLLEECPPQEDFSFETMDVYTPEALNVIGCEVIRLYAEDNGSRHPLENDGQPVFSYAFGPSFGKYSEETNFDPLSIQRDFNLYQLRSYTTKAFIRQGRKVSLRRTAHELFPIFAFVYVHKDKNGKENQWGQIIQPEWHTDDRSDDRSSFYFYTGSLTEFKVNKKLFGDAVATSVFSGSLVKPAVLEAGTNEPLLLTKVVQVKDGDEVKEEETELRDEEIRVNNVILCKDGLNAINAYYRLNALRTSYAYHSDFGDVFFHVCWTRNDTSEFSTYLFSLLKKLATNKYLMLDVDTAGKKRAFQLCRRFTSFRMASLPERIKDSFFISEGGRTIPCKDIRSFFRCYELGEEECYAYEKDINLLFLSFLTAALPIEPLVRCEKYDKKTGKLLEYFYKVDSSCFWQFMATEGYCREVDKNTTDRIGRYIKIEGPFVEELDIKSLLGVGINALKDFAKRIAKPGTEDYRKMCNAVNASREIVDKTAINLPEMEVDYRGGYGPELDHFFYKNGALRITPHEITFIPYKDLDFNVDKAEQLPFNFYMPCGKNELPFTITENPEYLERVKILNEHRADAAHYTLKDLEREEQELEQWMQRNRWLFVFRDENTENWWKPLLVLRCFANEAFEKEEELKRKGESFSDEDMKTLYGHLANILYALGRPLFRYRGDGTNYIPYITENGVSKEGRSEGGSGKSVFVNTFMGCAGKVLAINSRNLRPDSDISLQLANFVPHCHRVVHWEDWERLPIDPLYNYATSGFEFRDFHKKAVRIELKDSPGHVITSNFQQTYEDPSSGGRILPTGFSHRFNRGDVRKNKPQRKLDAVMPAFRQHPEDIDPESRSQIAFLCAMAVQFCMKAKERVFPPMEDLNYRSRVVSLGGRFIEWADNFFKKAHVLNCPIDMDTIFEEYRDLCESSEDKRTKFSPGTFKDKIKEYCGDIGIVVLPDVCFSSDTDRAKGYMRVKAWCRETFFDDEKIWGKGMRKDIRVLKHSSKCLFFCKEDSIPADREAVKQLCKDYYGRPDPDPIVDGDGEPVTLTDEEVRKWERFKARRQGDYAPIAPATPAAPIKGEVGVPEDLPF